MVRRATTSSQYGDLAQTTSAELQYGSSCNSFRLASETPERGTGAWCTLLGALKIIETQGSYILFLRPAIIGIPEIMVCRILVLMWSFGALSIEAVVGDFDSMPGTSVRDDVTDFQA